MAFSSAHAEIISVKTMKSVQARVEAALEIHRAEDVLVAFDIDMTLIQSDHPAVCYPAIKKYWGIFRVPMMKFPGIEIFNQAFEKAMPDLFSLEPHNG